MIDYGVKAPTEQVILDNLAAAKIGSMVDGEDLVPAFQPAPGVSYVFLGRIRKIPPTYAKDGETIITEAIFTDDVHADLRFDGPDAAVLVARLKRRTTIAAAAPRATPTAP